MPVKPELVSARNQRAGPAQLWDGMLDVDPGFPLSIARFYFSPEWHSFRGNEVVLSPAPELKAAAQGVCDLVCAATSATDEGTGPTLPIAASTAPPAAALRRVPTAPAHARWSFCFTREETEGQRFTIRVGIRIREISEHTLWGHYSLG
ncbi:hypothetical protein PAL_GLEAN10019450 [Pteropus alecto]|uniref:Uncharacterized protein n=1 Tax=Pteropus alecto TaxID=9402 RepID=L5JTS4_PTEAL|nr:hypothetical protein PAL_GLEAN10019450 [Pteropus alecto]